MWNLLVSVLIWGGLGLFAIILVLLTLGVIKEYEKGVVFRLGKYNRINSSGLYIIIPFIENIKVLDIRTKTIDVKPQEVITKDNVTITVDAVVYFNIFDAKLAICAAEDYLLASSLIAQTTLRDVIGEYELDKALSGRSEISQKLQEIIDKETDPWGVKVTNVEIKQIALPDNMKRVMAAEAEAERDRRAKVIHAEGELQASYKLIEAATAIAKEPTAFQLRFLQTLTEIASEKNMVIVVPLPEKIIATISQIGSGVSTK